MENQLMKVDERDLIVYREPEVVLEEAHRAAKALTDVINQKRKKVIINNETYLEFEDWMLIARFYGISVKVVSTTPVTFDEVKGFESRAEAILMRSGEIISAAEAMTLNDERNWKDRPLFMLRSMAQTRACAKALRNVLGWVPVLAGFKSTPAEEMDSVNGDRHQEETYPEEMESPQKPKEDAPWRNEPSSEKQQGAIKGIMKAQGMSEDAMKDKAFKILGHPVGKIESLTRGEASKLIEAFQKGGK